MLINSIVVKSKEKFHTAFILIVAWGVSSLNLYYRAVLVFFVGIVVLVELMVRLHFSKSIK